MPDAAGYDRWVSIRRRYVENEGDLYGLVNFLHHADAHLPQTWGLSDEQTAKFYWWVGLRRLFEGLLDYKEFVQLLHLCDGPLGELAGFGRALAPMAFDAEPKCPADELLDFALSYRRGQYNAKFNRKLEDLVRQAPENLESSAEEAPAFAGGAATGPSRGAPPVIRNAVTPWWDGLPASDRALSGYRLYWIYKLANPAHPGTGRTVRGIIYDLKKRST
jgi:hypothetical protein